MRVCIHVCVLPCTSGYVCVLLHAQTHVEIQTEIRISICVLIDTRGGCVRLEIGLLRVSEGQAVSEGAWLRGPRGSEDGMEGEAWSFGTAEREECGGVVIAKCGDIWREAGKREDDPKP